MPSIRTVVCLILLLFTQAAKGQSYLYSEHELLFNSDKEHMKLLSGQDGSLHLWRWGISSATVTVYNARLQFLYTKTISKKADKILFLPLKDRYYVLLVDPKNTRVFCMSEAENCVDKTAALSKIAIADAPVAYIQPGTDKLYFIQYAHRDNADDIVHKAQMTITSVDTGLNYKNSLQLGINVNTFQLRNMRVYTLGNEVLILNRSVEDDATKLNIHKVNIETGKVLSKAFWFQDEMFVPEQILPYGNEIILQGYASWPLYDKRRQTSYTYLIRLDSNLNKLSSFQSAVGDTSIPENFMHVYLPVSTAVLPDNNLLIIDYKRAINTKNFKAETQLRFNRLDSNMNVVKKIEQSTIDYNNYPSFLFTENGRVNLYYEETIKRDIVIVHGCQLNESIENDRILQLRPKNRYLLRNAITTGNSSFVMPYLRNYKLGLVSVKVPKEYE